MAIFFIFVTNLLNSHRSTSLMQKLLSDYTKETKSNEF